MTSNVDRYAVPPSDSLLSRSDFRTIPSSSGGMAFRQKLHTVFQKLPGSGTTALHQALADRDARLDVRLAREVEKLWFTELEERARGLKGIASTLGRCDNFAEDSRPGTAQQAVVTR